MLRLDTVTKLFLAVAAIGLPYGCSKQREVIDKRCHYERPGDESSKVCNYGSNDYTGGYGGSGGGPNGGYQPTGGYYPGYPGYPGYPRVPVVNPNATGGGSSAGGGSGGSNTNNNNINNNVNVLFPWGTSGGGWTGSTGGGSSGGSSGGYGCHTSRSGNIVTISCDDGSVTTLRDGQDGAAGRDGRDGADGTSCSVRAVTGGYEIYCTDGARAFVRDGKDGNSCSVVTITDGAILSCSDGSHYTVRNGRDGRDGTNGTSCSVVELTTGARIVCTDGSTALVKNGNSCTTRRVYGGALVECTDGTVSMIYDGSDGVDGLNGLNGTSCRVEDTPTGGKVICGDGSTVVLYDGLNGRDGTSCTVSSSPTGATISCSDGRTAFVSNGKDGIDGLNGTSCGVIDTATGARITCSDGSSVEVKDGKDGKSCSVAPVAGGARLYCSDGTSVVVYDGKDGLNGLNGLNGTSCSTTTVATGSLINCSDGTSSIVKNGKDGSSCSVVATALGAKINCTDGTSADVLNGKDGRNGLDGLNGTSCTVTQVPEGGKITCPDGSTVIIKNCVSCGCDFLCSTEAPTDIFSPLHPSPAYAFRLTGLGDFVTSTKMKFVENSNGTAKLTGEVYLRGFPNKKLQVDLSLSGYSTTAPAGSPMKDLKTAAYSENGGPVNASLWTYYTGVAGYLVGAGDYSGAKILVSRMGTAFQMGDGASGKNILKGASVSLSTTVVTQPLSGPSLALGTGYVTLAFPPCDDVTPPTKTTRLWEVNKDGRLWSFDNYMSPRATAKFWGNLLWKNGNVLVNVPSTIDGMAINPQGIAFFTVNGGGGAVCGAPGPVLISLDLKTVVLNGPNVVTVIGTISPNYGRIRGLEFDHATGKLYAIGAGTTNRLLTINPVTAAASIVGAFNSTTVKSPEELEMDAAGNLYLSDDSGDKLYQINKSNGQTIATTNGNIANGLPKGVKTEALAWSDADSKMVAFDHENVGMFLISMLGAASTFIESLAPNDVVDPHGADFW